MGAIMKDIIKAIWKISFLIGVPLLTLFVFIFLITEWWEYLIFGTIVFIGIIVGILDNLGTWKWSRFYE